MTPALEAFRLMIVSQARLWKEFRGTQLEWLALEHLAEAVEHYEQLLPEKVLEAANDESDASNPL